MYRLRGQVYCNFVVHTFRGEDRDHAGTGGNAASSAAAPQAMTQVFVALVQAVSSDSVETWVSGGGGGGASAARGVMLTLFIALDDGEARGV